MELGFRGGVPITPPHLLFLEVQMGRKQEKQQSDGGVDLGRPGIDSDSLANLGES